MANAETVANTIRILTKRHKCMIMLIGIPGSGKSTFVEDYLHDFMVVNSSDVRKDLIHEDPEIPVYKKLNEEVDKRLIDILDSYNNVIYDSTNCFPKGRNECINAVRDHCDLVIGVVIDRPFIDCYAKIAHVGIPSHRMENMYWTLKHKAPALKEGFDILLSISEE